MVSHARFPPGAPQGLPSESEVAAARGASTRPSPAGHGQASLAAMARLASAGWAFMALRLLVGFFDFGLVSASA